MATDRRVWMAAAVLVLVAGPALQAAEVGDKAPALSIAEWIKGGPVTLADGKGKTIYVVEFWATWCGPCKDSIPHLTQLQKEFADKGVVIIGVTDEEPQEVKDWIAEVGKPGPNQIKMEYTVAADSGRKTSAAFKSRLQRGIPHAYVVDKTGTIVWNGHPMNGLDGVLTRVVAGTFDPKLEQKKRDLRQKAIMAFQQRQVDQFVAHVDQMIAADINDPESYRLKIAGLDAARRPDDAQKVRADMATIFDKDSDVLTELAWHYATTEALTARRPAKAVKLAKKAVALTKSKDAQVLHTLARAYYTVCNLAKAIETQKQAVALASGDEKETTQAALDYYLGVQKAAAEGTK